MGVQAQCQVPDFWLCRTYQRSCFEPLKTFRCHCLQRRYKPAHFAVLSGDDNLTLPMLACGMDGLISVIANAYPKGYSDMVRAGLNEDFATARNLHYLCMNMVDLLFADGNPAGIKKVLEVLEICGQEVRLPLVPANATVQKAIEAEIIRIQTTFSIA